MFWSSSPRDTESEALQGWILKFGDCITILRTIVGTFVDWLDNGNLTWVDYREFMSSRLIAIDKQPGVRPVGVGDTWWRLFSKIAIKFMGPEATMACQDEHLCARLKAGINGAIHRFQALWDKNSSTEEWGFWIADAKNAFNKIY